MSLNKQQGKRFSEDIDRYAAYPEDFKTELDKALARRGLSLLKSRQTNDTSFFEISDGATTMKLEMTKKRINGTLAVYLKADGNALDVLTLKAEELILEKLAAYKSRRKIRDIYNIYFLSRFAALAGPNEKIRGFLKTIKDPVDEEDLRTIVYGGTVPMFEEMIEKLKV